MRLSKLQKHILSRSLEARGKFDRERLMDFFPSSVLRKESMDAVTKSLERLIDHELMTGYGVRTPHKWYIKEVRLTPLGRKEAKRIRGEQQKLL